MRPSVTLVRCCFVLTAGTFLVTPTLEARADDNVIELIATKKDDAKLVLSEDVTFSIPDEIEVVSGSALKAKVDFHFRALNPKGKMHHCTYNGKILGFWAKFWSKLTGTKKDSLLVLKKCNHGLKAGSEAMGGEFRLKLHGMIAPLKVRLALSTDSGTEPTPTPTAEPTETPSPTPTSTPEPTPSPTTTPTPEALPGFVEACLAPSGSKHESLVEQLLLNAQISLADILTKSYSCSDAAVTLSQKTRIKISGKYEESSYLLPKRLPHQIDDFSLLKEFSHIDTLVIYDGITRDISFLEFLPNLRVLSIYYNKIVDISPITNLPHLEVLRLPGNEISDLFPLSTMTQLRSLVLNDNQISDISPLANLTGLQRLSLRSNRITDFEVICNLPIRLDSKELSCERNPSSFRIERCNQEEGAKP